MAEQPRNGGAHPEVRLAGQESFYPSISQIRFAKSNTLKTLALQDRRTWASNFLLYRGRPSSTGKFDGLCVFVLPLFKASQPELADVADFPDADQLLLLGPIECDKDRTNMEFVQ
jgi:hypothetical protein